VCLGCSPHKKKCIQRQKRHWQYFILQRIEFYVSSFSAMLFLVTVQRFVGARPRGRTSTTTKRTEQNTGRGRGLEVVGGGNSTCFPSLLICVVNSYLVRLPSGSCDSLRPPSVYRRVWATSVSWPTVRRPQHQTDCTSETSDGCSLSKVS
jgi:hypothetical protein